MRNGYQLAIDPRSTPKNAQSRSSMRRRLVSPVVSLSTPTALRRYVPAPAFHVISRAFLHRHDVHVVYIHGLSRRAMFRRLHLRFRAVFIPSSCPPTPGVRSRCRALPREVRARTDGAEEPRAGPRWAGGRNGVRKYSVWVIQERLKNPSSAIPGTLVGS